NLMLARVSARRAEIAVRRALGAGRLQLLRLTLAESAVLTFAAAAAGVALSYWAVAAVVALAPADVPRLDEIGLNVRALAFAVGAASALPLSHEGSEMDPPYVIVGQAPPAAGDEPTALTTFVTPGYFAAIGMHLVQGRVLTERDTAASTPVVVINETMAHRAW